MRVLIVEDEPRMSALLRQGLEEENYAVDALLNGADVLHWVQSTTYDLLVLDIMLPGMNGLVVCRQLRDKGYQMPILMLTAKDTLIDKVKGLDSGADDYLIKPFELEELMARLRALSRRNGPSKTLELQVGDLRLDTLTKRVCRGNETWIDLTGKEYRLLETFMRHPNQVLSREQIINHVWDADFDAGSKLIEVYIHALRKKIDEGRSHKFIQTLRGLGYRISADVSAE